MFLYEYGLCNNKKIEEQQLLIDKSYKYWQDTLFEKCIRIFNWSGLPFPQKEIEMRLLLNGFCGVVDDALKGVMVATGSMSGVTQYFDEFTDFTYASATARGGTKKINRDCVIVNNTAIRNPLFPMICRTASLLAHSEISLKCALVNMRETNSFSCDNEATAESVKAYHKQAYNGKLDVIVDSAIVKDGSINNLTQQNKGALGVMDCIDARNEILRSFFNEIGVRYNRDKKERMVESEVSSDTQLLLVNIKDMERERKDACERINKIFGLQTSVEISEEFKPLLNERGVEDGNN